MLSAKLKAGVLYYTLFVSLVLLLLVGLFLLIFYQDSFFIANIKRSERINCYFTSAMAFALTDKASSDNTTELTLFNNDKDSKVAISQQKWGLYNILTLSLPGIPKVPSRSYLIGISPHDTIRQTGLYLRNNFSYLSISGSTILSGRTYLPYSGVASSSVEGTGYHADSLCYGVKLTSRDSLPGSFYNRLEKWLSWTYGVKSIPVSQSRVTSSFSSETTIIEPSRLIAGMHLDGKIIIRSKQPITISNTTYLKNAIVVAPKVFVDSRFKGSCQIFATDTVIIGRGAMLQYPSGIAILSKEGGYVQIDSSAKMYGYLLVHSGNSKKIRLKIMPTAKIFGYVYCNAKVNHQGIIFGALYANDFEFRTRWGLYTSTLLNAKILGRELSPTYLYPFIVPGHKAIIGRLP